MVQVLSPSVPEQFPADMKGGKKGLHNHNMITIAWQNNEFITLQLDNCDKYPYCLQKRIEARFARQFVKW